MAKPIEPVKNATVLLAVTTNSHVELPCEYTDPATGQIEAATVKVPYTRFDESIRKFVPDQEAMARANEILNKALGVDVASIDDAIGKHLKLYIRNGSAYVFPVKPFVRFTRLIGADAKALKKLAQENTVFDTVPLTEYEGRRFNFGISAVIDGEVKNFRISQFEITNDEGEDQLIGCKYQNRSLQQYEEQLNANDSMSEEHRTRVKARLQDMLQRARAARIEQLNAALGIDVNKLLATDDSLKVHVSVRAIPSSKYSFLIATLAQ